MFSVLRSFAAPAAILATVALAPAASAGGSLKDEPVGVVVDWSGVYMGIHAGGGWSQVDTAITDPAWLVFLLDGIGAPTSTRQDVDGFLFGGHVGLQRQFGRWVLGLEATFTGGKLDGTSSTPFGGAINFGRFGLNWDGTTDVKTEISDIFTATVRLGHAWERTLAYLKGGYASAEIGTNRATNVDFALCGGACFPLGSIGGSTQSSERHDGWTIGAGLEYLLAPNVTIGVEYNYIDLAAKTHAALTTVAINGTPIGTLDSRVRVDPDAIHAVYARLSFKFGHDAPPPAYVPLK